MGTGSSLFRTCKRIHTGIGCVIHLSEEIQRISPSRILVITDPEMKRVGALDRVKELLAGGKFTLEEFEGIDIEPTLETLERCLKWIGGKKFDAVIGLGGRKLDGCGKGGCHHDCQRGLPGGLFGD